MNYKIALQAIERKVGRPPRKGLLQMSRNRDLARRIRNAERIQVAAGDAISKIYQYEQQIVRDGEVRWATVIQANNSLFVPAPHTSGAQILYSPSGIAPLDALAQTAQRIFHQKGTVPEDEDERKLAHMITDEYERALDWRIPKSLSDGFDMVTTILLVPRKLIPGGILTGDFIPILADPATSLALLIPHQFWAAEFAKQWSDNALEILTRLNRDQKAAAEDLRQKVAILKQRKFDAAPVKLTKRASEEILKRMENAGLLPSKTRVRFGLELLPSGPGGYKMGFEDVEPADADDLAYRLGQVNVVVDYSSLVYMLGTIVDWQESEGGVGFRFIPPDAGEEF